MNDTGKPDGLKGQVSEVEDVTRPEMLGQEKDEEFALRSALHCE